MVVKNEQSGKRRMVIDYSRTINRYTSLDAYPLPQIEDIVSELSKYKVFTTVDLKSAYHQIENLMLFKQVKNCISGADFLSDLQMPYRSFNEQSTLLWLRIIYLVAFLTWTISLSLAKIRKSMTPT